MEAPAMTARPARKGRRIRQRPEEALHMAVARFLDVALPSDATWLHVPNGGRRTKTEAGKFKAMGVRAGVADLLLFRNGHSYAMELKALDGRISVAQDIWRRSFEDAGGKWACVWSLEQTEMQLRKWGIPLKATLNAGAGWSKAA
jgi:hypothetical protein